MSNIFQGILKAIGGGVILYLLQKAMQTDFLSKFLSNNLVTILFALLAINAATLGVVLTKIRDLIDSTDKSGSFAETRKQMLFSI